MSETRWGLLKDLALCSGMAKRTLQYIQKREPGVLVMRETPSGFEYDIGGCNRNLRVREVALAEKARGPREAPAKDPTVARKEEAEAALAELRLRREEAEYLRDKGDLINLEQHRHEVALIFQHLRALLQQHPKTRDHVKGIIEQLRAHPPTRIAARTNAA